MHRRRYLATLGLATATSLAGCSGTGGQTSGGTENVSGANATESRGAGTSTPAEATETATGASTTARESATDGAASTDGLPAAPAEETPGTPAAEFTTSGASTPIAADAFTSTLEGQLEEKSLSTAYLINTLEDQQTVELTYVADESNQRKHLEAFAESFVETVARTGGTGGWMLDMTVQTGADREVWYTWQVRDEWAIQRLTGEISREEFYTKIEGTTATATQAE